MSQTPQNAFPLHAVYSSQKHNVPIVCVGIFCVLSTPSLTSHHLGAKIDGRGRVTWNANHPTETVSGASCLKAVDVRTFGYTLTIWKNWASSSLCVQLQFQTYMAHDAFSPQSNLNTVFFTYKTHDPV